jgi:hypothetical protein
MYMKTQKQMYFIFLKDPLYYYPFFLIKIKNLKKSNWSVHYGY